MLEQRRVDYLKAMGITLWMPRQALPHAKESRWLPENNDERHEHIAISHTGDSSRPIAAADLLRAGQPMHKHENVAPQESSKPARSEKEAVTPPPQQIAQAPASDHATSQVDSEETMLGHDMTPPRFALDFIPISRQGLWVVDGKESVQEIQQFAYRVLKGMGAAPEFMSQPINFRWPFIESSHQDQSRPVALQALQAQWQFLKSQGVRYVITIGGDAQEWMSAVQAESYFHIADFSLCQNDAQIKRELWLSLRQLSEL